jgi:hypothetical protein
VYFSQINAMTHKNGCAIFQGLVSASRHGNNGDAEVDAERVHTEEAEEGENSDHVTSSLPKMPGRAQPIVDSSEKHDF